jgi:TonB family protein
MLRILIALLLLLTTATAHADRLWQINAALDLDAQGQLTDLRFRDELPPQLEEPLRQRIAQWHFSPVLANGVPSAATVNLFVSLLIEDVGDKLRFRIREAGTNLHSVDARPPRYPAGELRAGRGGYAVVKLLVGEDGRVLERSTVDATNEQFSKAALKAARDWRFEPLLINGRPARGEIYLPISFALSGQPMPKIDLSNLIGVTLEANRPALAASVGGQLLSEDIQGLL